MVWTFFFFFIYILLIMFHLEFGLVIFRWLFGLVGRLLSSISERKIERDRGKKTWNKIQNEWTFYNIQNKKCKKYFMKTITIYQFWRENHQPVTKKKITKQTTCIKESLIFHHQTNEFGFFFHFSYTRMKKKKRKWNKKDSIVVVLKYSYIQLSYPLSSLLLVLASRCEAREREREKSKLKW